MRGILNTYKVEEENKREILVYVRFYERPRSSDITRNAETACQACELKRTTR